MNGKLFRNINVLYVFSFFWVAMVIIPVMVPFFQTKGLTLAQVFFLQSIFALFVVVFEVPSGYVADMLGRRNALLAGSLFHGIGFTWLYFADDFVDLVLFEMTVGLGLSLLSGADLSLLYDSQQALGQSTSERTRGIANMRFIKSCSEGVSALLGGIVVAWGFDKVVVVNALFAWVPFFLAFFLVEAPYTRMAEGQLWGNMKQILSHMYVEDRLLRLVCLAITFFGLMTFYVVWLLQPYWEDQGIPFTWFGFLWAAQSFLFAVSTRVCVPMEDRFGPAPVLVVMAATPAIGYFGMSVTGGIVGILFSFLFFVSRGLNQVILTDALNRRVPSSFRSTANSMTSFMFRAVFIVTGPVVGLLVDWTGMYVTLAILGVTATVVCLWVLVPLLLEIARIGAPPGRQAG